MPAHVQIVEKYIRNQQFCPRGGVSTCLTTQMAGQYGQLCDAKATVYVVTTYDAADMTLMEEAQVHKIDFEHCSVGILDIYCRPRSLTIRARCFESKLSLMRLDRNLLINYVYRTWCVLPF